MFHHEQFYSKTSSYYLLDKHHITSQWQLPKTSKTHIEYIRIFKKRASLIYHLAMFPYVYQKVFHEK